MKSRGSLDAYVSVRFFYQAIGALTEMYCGKCFKRLYVLVDLLLKLTQFWDHLSESELLMLEDCKESVCRLQIHSQQQSKSLVRRVCVGVEPLHNRGTQSSAINHAGQVLDALMLWEPTLRHTLQNFPVPARQESACRAVTHSVTGALVLKLQGEFMHRRKRRFLPCCQNPIQAEVMSSDSFFIQ